MKLKVVGISFCVLAFYAMINSLGCSSNSLLESKPGESKSHYFGQSCLQCHSGGNQSKIIFSVAGSMLDEQRKKPNTNARVEIYTGVNSTGEKVLELHT